MKPIEELPKEPKIGKKYMFEEEIVKCVKLSWDNTCNDCVLNDIGSCCLINCMSCERHDFKDIKIVKC